MGIIDHSALTREESSSLGIQYQSIITKRQYTS
jgi:hypothetical protein